MYGISDFEAKIATVSDSEMAPHLSTELGSIPWDQERELLPKLFGNQKYVYKGDFLSDLLVQKQERIQDIYYNSFNNLKRFNDFYHQKIVKIENRLDDKDLLPTIGLGTLAGIIGWKNNHSQLLPVKFIYFLGAVSISSLLTHERLRSILIQKMSENIPKYVKDNANLVDEKIGSLGARVWNCGDELYSHLKDKIVNKKHS